VSAPPRHLAIRAPNWVGDLVMATPVLAAARADPRFHRVSVVVRPHLRGLIEDGGLVPEAIPAEGDEAGLWRRLAPDAVLLLSSSLGAAWRAFRGGVPVRAGLALGARRWLLTHRLAPPARDGRRLPAPTAEALRGVAGLLGIRVERVDPVLPLDEGTRGRGRELLARAGLAAGEPYALCSPSAAFGAAKLWPPESFAAALDALHEEHGLRGVVTGGPGEEPQMRAVVRAARHPVVSLEGQERDLVVLKALVAEARILLACDSGPRWYAAAFGTPCVTVMGPNFPELTASSLERCEVVRVEGLECSPCLRRRCPLGHHRCMRELHPDAVVAAARRLLAGPSAAAG